MFYFIKMDLPTCGACFSYPKVATAQELWLKISDREKATKSVSQQESLLSEVCGIVFH